MEGIEDILEDALKRMEAQIADARATVERLETELEAAATCLAAATAHATKLRKMLDDPYLSGPIPAAARIETAPVQQIERQPAPALEAPAPRIEHERLVPMVVSGVRPAPRVPLPAGPQLNKPLSAEEIEARNRTVLAALSQLWEMGDRVLASDVERATGWGKDIVYRALQMLKAHGDIQLVPEPIQPGDKRTCNAIRPKDWRPPHAKPVVRVSKALADRALRYAGEVRPGSVGTRVQRILAGFAIRESGLNVMVRDVANAVGVDAPNLAPSQARSVKITQAEIDTVSAMLRVGMGLPDPDSRESPALAPPQSQDKPAPTAPSAAPARSPAMALDIEEERSSKRKVPMVELAPNQCKWPVNEARDPADFVFCGADRLDDSPYCAHHEDRARARRGEAAAA